MRELTGGSVVDLDRVLIIDDASNNRVSPSSAAPQAYGGGDETDRAGGVEMAVAEERTVPPALEGFAGRVLSPDDADYEGARQIYNALITKRPRRSRSARASPTSWRPSRPRGTKAWRLSVRGGGHAVSGRALTDGGLTIDLSRMKGIHVDPQNNTVRAQPGVN